MIFLINAAFFLKQRHEFQKLLKNLDMQLSILEAYHSALRIIGLHYDVSEAREEISRAAVKCKKVNMQEKLKIISECNESLCAKIFFYEENFRPRFSTHVPHDLMQSTIDKMKNELKVISLLH